MPNPKRPPSPAQTSALRLACSLAAWALCASLAPAVAQTPDAAPTASTTPANPQAACQAHQAEQDHQYALVADPRGDQRTSIDRQKLAELRRQCHGAEDGEGQPDAAAAAPSS